jgi:S1/P1 Nuclease
MKMTFSFLFLSALLFGWGPEGHHAIARIAGSNLNPKAIAAVKDLLGVSMAEVSTWADEIRPQRRETAPWHYINIPIDAVHTSSADYCPKDGCVVSKIEDLVKTLKTSTNREDRAEALKFLIHFVGDMHQPLHAGDKKDRGGNDTKVVYFGQEFNLHRIWDSDLLARMDNNEDHLVNSLRASWWQRRKMSQGGVEDWVWESRDIARDVAYKNLMPQLSEAYQKAAEPALRLQLQRGGIRLAKLLDESLGK